ncbi:TonB-dependent receptor [Flavicella marina]|uniref:TonB-dependent receptor n=1 Tax=Flavicella marina TaxID=1475951 RepID=UPI001264C5B3|nr:TonB-dependent receptor [Flavicella marina]
MKKLIIMLLLISNGVNAQRSTVVIEVIDGAEKYPLMGAHICLVTESNNKHYFSTDENGKVEVPNVENSNVTLSFVGYKTITIPVLKSEFMRVRLNPDLLALNQVVVTATVVPQKVDASIYKIEVIDGRTMEKQGVQNARDALRFQPNINLIEDGVLGSQIIMQGLEGQHVKFLIDGVPIIGRQDGNVDLSQIDMSQVDHIEIIEGPMSVVYGSNALAGTINIITKQNKYYNWSGNATVYAESVGQYNGSVSVSGNVGKSKFGLTGGYRVFDGYDLDTSTRTMSWNPKNQTNADAFYGIGYGGWDAKIGLRFSQEDLTYRGAYLIPYRAIDTEFVTERWSGYSNFSKNFTDTSVFSGLVSYNIYERTSQEYVVKEDLDIETKRGDASKDVFNTLNARLSYSRDFTVKIQWQLGYELTDEVGEGEKVTNNDGLVENALWTDLQLNLSEHFTIQPGVRIVHHSIYKAALMYALHLKWKPNKSWQSRISFAKGFRAPSMKELYMDFVDSNHKIFGNENLEPETSYNLTATIEKTISLSENNLLKFNVTGFHNHLFDVIELASDETGTQYIYQNVSEKSTHGATFSTNYQYQFFKLNFGVALTGIGYDLYSNGYFDYQYATDFTAMSVIQLRKIDLAMQLDYKYTDQRSQLLLRDTTEDVTVGTVEGYNMLNFSMTKNFSDSGLSLTAGLKNIFDIKTVANSAQSGAHANSSNRLITWGRTAFISLKYNFTKI